MEKPLDAEAAMAEIWGIIAPDCESTDYDGIVARVAQMQTAIDAASVVLNGK